MLLPSAALAAAVVLRKRRKAALRAATPTILCHEILNPADSTYKNLLIVFKNATNYFQLRGSVTSLSRRRTVRRRHFSDLQFF